MNPLVSIIIPVYNGSNYMREAIDSAIGQTYKNIEIIVVNDGSTDNTREIALSYGDKIRYFEKENGGVSTALNLGIKEMKGEYFSWLSHDDVYYPNKIEAEIDALKSSGNMNMAVYSGWDELLMPERNIKNYPLLSDYYGVNYFTSGLFAVTNNLINGLSLLIPRSFFYDRGLFDEKYRGVQDYLKWFQMFHDKRLIFVDKVLVQSRSHDRQVTNLYRKFEEEKDEIFLYMMENIDEHDIENLGINDFLYYGGMLFHAQGCGYLRTYQYILDRLLATYKNLDIDSTENNYLRKWLDSQPGQGLYIYCAGRYGKAIKSALEARMICIDGISDSNPDKWGSNIDQLTICSPSEIPKNSNIIIANVKDPETIRFQLEQQGFRYCIRLEMFMEKIYETPISNFNDLYS